MILLSNMTQFNQMTELWILVPCHFKQPLKTIESIFRWQYRTQKLSLQLHWQLHRKLSCCVPIHNNNFNTLKTQTWSPHAVSCQVLLPSSALSIFECETSHFLSHFSQQESLVPLEYPGYHGHIIQNNFYSQYYPYVNLKILPQNTLLCLLKVAISSIITPSSVLRNYQFSPPLGADLGGTHFTGFVLDSARTMRWPA